MKVRELIAKLQSLPLRSMDLEIEIENTQEEYPTFTGIRNVTYYDDVKTVIMEID